jgi:hypothetical protein
MSTIELAGDVVMATGFWIIGVTLAWSLWQRRTHRTDAEKERIDRVMGR